MQIVVQFYARGDKFDMNMCDVPAAQERLVTPGIWAPAGLARTDERGLALDGLRCGERSARKRRLIKRTRLRYTFLLFPLADRYVGNFDLPTSADPSGHLVDVLPGRMRPLGKANNLADIFTSIAALVQATLFGGVTNLILSKCVASAAA